MVEAVNKTVNNSPVVTTRRERELPGWMKRVPSDPDLKEETLATASLFGAAETSKEKAKKKPKLL